MNYLFVETEGISPVGYVSSLDGKLVDISRLEESRLVHAPSWKFRCIIQSMMYVDIGLYGGL